MSPILKGIVASGISGHLTPAATYESIQTVIVGGTAPTSIDFTSIPSTYKHLQVRWIGRITPSTSDENLAIQVGNGSVDTGSNYSVHYMYGAGGVNASTGGSGSQTSTNIGRVTGATAAANVFGTGVLDLPDYQNTNKQKTFTSLSGSTGNGTGIVWEVSGSWRSTAAIDTIKFIHLYGSGGFAQYSQFELFGIRG
jgi:hypothetical protein